MEGRPAILGRVIVLLLIYNPTLTFIVQGLALMAISITGAILLSSGPVGISYLGLSIHSFIVAALGVLAAFQLVIFGVAAALYGVEAGKRPTWWLLRVISVRWPWMASLGTLLMLASLAKLIDLTIEWAGTTYSPTRARWSSPPASWCSGFERSPRLSSSRSSAGSAGSPSGERPSTSPADPRSMRVSAVVVNYNGADALEGCLGALVSGSDPATTEILVVDNASTDGSAAIAERLAAEHHRCG